MFSPISQSAWKGTATLMAHDGTMHVCFETQGVDIAKSSKNNMSSLPYCLSLSLTSKTVRSSKIRRRMNYHRPRTTTLAIADSMILQWRINFHWAATSTLRSSGQFPRQMTTTANANLTQVVRHSSASKNATNRTSSLATLIRSFLQLVLLLPLFRAIIRAHIAPTPA